MARYDISGIDLPNGDSLDFTVESELYFATYGVTTQPEILEAYKAGKILFCLTDANGSKVIPLSSHQRNDDNGSFVFAGVADSYQFIILTCTKTNGWSVNSPSIYSRLIPAGGTTGQLLAKNNDNDYALKWTTPPTEVFVAVYGQTSWVDLKAAYDDGKTIILRNSAKNNYGLLFKYDSSTNRFTFVEVNALNGSINTSACDFGDTWGGLGTKYFVPTSTTVNSHPLSSNVTLTASDVGAVPTGRTVNSKALSSNITLDASDVGAIAAPSSPTSGDILSYNGSSWVAASETTEVFWATYGTTTSAELEAAYQAGKLCLVYRNNRTYTLSYRGSATNHTFSCGMMFSYYGSDVGLLYGTVTCKSDSWNTGGSAFDYLQPKLTFDETPTVSSTNPVTSGGVYSAIPSAATVAPSDLGTAAVGSSSKYAKEDHVHNMPDADDVGAIATPSTAGTEGQQLTVDSNGDAAWADPLFVPGTGIYGSALQNNLEEGYENTASGATSFAIGSGSIASGNHSFAGGARTNQAQVGTTASANTSFAFGGSVTASALYATAFGNRTEASGQASFVSGNQSVASGLCSTAMGQIAQAQAVASAAIGDRITATGRACTVVGAFNELDNNTADDLHGAGSRKYIFMVGNGTADNARSNALTVDWDGNETLAGNLILGNETLSEERLSDCVAEITIGTPEVIADTTSISFSQDGSNEWYISTEDPISDICSNFNTGYLFKVEWDGVEYEETCDTYERMYYYSSGQSVPQDYPKGTTRMNAIGNMFPIGYANRHETNAPFAIVVNYSNDPYTGDIGAHFKIISYDTNATHTVKIIRSSLTQKIINPQFYAKVLSVGVDVDTPGTGRLSLVGPAANKASGDFSRSVGRGTISSGESSFAEGERAIASGKYSHAEGSSSQAVGNQSHAEGNYTKAEGNSSHSEGQLTVAGGVCSNASGTGSSASGRNAHAEGEYTISNHKNQHVFGKYNVADPSSAAATSEGNYIEIVGNGTADNARSNARTLDWSGNEALAGKLTLGAAPTNNMDAATKQYVDSAITTSAANVPTQASISSGGLISYKNSSNTTLFTLQLPIWDGSVT